MITYSCITVLVSSFILHTFLQDEEAQKDDWQSWLFIALAAAIWPITLPSIIRKSVFLKPEAPQLVIYFPDRVSSPKS